MYSIKNWWYHRLDSFVNAHFQLTMLLFKGDPEVKKTLILLCCTCSQEQKFKRWNILRFFMSYATENSIGKRRVKLFQWIYIFIKTPIFLNILLVHWNWHNSRLKFGIRCSNDVRLNIFKQLQWPFSSWKVWKLLNLLINNHVDISSMKNGRAKKF